MSEYEEKNDRSKYKKCYDCIPDTLATLNWVLVPLGWRIIRARGASSNLQSRAKGDEWSLTKQ